MLNGFIQVVKKNFHSRYPREIFVLSSVLMILILTFFCTVVMADDGQPDNSVGYYTKDGKVNWLTTDNKVAVDLGGVTPSEIERLFPMSTESEAAIVHQDLPCPVIVDGIRYEGNQISLFNGKRLYYVIGMDGVLQAFTTVKGLEAYQLAQPARSSTQTRGQESYFFEDWLYSGDSIALNPGCGLPNLSQIEFDEVISSVKVNAAAEWAYLYDQNNFTGNCLSLPGGQKVPQLATYGWNDRALSVEVE